MNLVLSILAFTVLRSPALPQEVPQEVAKKDLPKLAKCLMCPDHGAEKVAGGLSYKGATYFFCNAKEIAAFKKDPEAFVPPVLPREMPALGLSDLTGKVWNREGTKGKVVLVDFWATWCAPCKEMMPMLDRLHGRYRDQGFEILSVSIDEKKSELDKFLKQHTFPNPVLHDTQKTWEKWGVRSIPAMFLVKDGKIVAQWSGKTSESALDSAIKAHLKR